MDTSLSPQDLENRAKAAYGSGDYTGSAAMYAQAAGLYAGTGDALMAAEMKNNQSVALLRGKEPQAALEAARGTETVFAAVGDLRRQGMALANQASALQSLKQYKEAIDDYHRSAEALEKAGEGDLRVEVMQLLSMLYLRRFKFYDAVLALQSGIAGAKNLTPRQRLMKKVLFIRL
jgi:tetratricopeptide (TPR) repeat protein